MNKCAGITRKKHGFQQVRTVTIIGLTTAKSSQPLRTHSIHRVIETALEWLPKNCLLSHVFFV